VLVRLALRLVILAAIIGLTAALISGIHVHGGFGSWLWIALLFSVVNLIIGPLARLLSLPLTILTFGLFLLVVNAGLLGLTALLTKQLSIDNFWSALLGGIVISVCSWGMNLLVPLRPRRRKAR
jgi:putative membrane protein